MADGLNCPECGGSKLRPGTVFRMAGGIGPGGEWVTCDHPMHADDDQQITGCPTCGGERDNPQMMVPTFAAGLVDPLPEHRCDDPFHDTPSPERCGGSGILGWRRDSELGRDRLMRCSGCEDCSPDAARDAEVEAQHRYERGDD